MEKIDIIICLKKRTKNKKNTKKLLWDQKFKIKNFDFFFRFIVEKTEQETVYFEENSIIKSDFHKNKKLININEVDIEDIVLSHKKSYGNFIGYRHKGNAFPSPLCLKIPQMNAYAKYFDKNSKCMNLLVNDK